MVDRPCDYCGGPGGQPVEDDYECDGCRANAIAIVLIAALSGLGVLALLSVLAV